MILPKKLQPVTEDQLLLEVSDELKIDIKDVNRTFDIWLKFLNYIANDTDQATMYIPSLGTMYVSNWKMRRDKGINDFRKRKRKEINKSKEQCQYSVNDNIPIILKYGLSRRNKYGENEKDSDRKEFFTPRELINNQTNFFFDEDVEFSEKKKLKQYFIINE